MNEIQIGNLTIRRVNPPQGKHDSFPVCGDFAFEVDGKPLGLLTSGVSIHFDVNFNAVRVEFRGTPIDRGEK